MKSSTKLKTTLALFALTSLAAAPSYAADLIQAALNITDTLAFVANLATAVAYILGFGYAMSAIMKFKKHRDSPSQIPLSIPITECFMAATLIFLPLLANLSGDMIFSEGTVKTDAHGNKKVVYQPYQTLPGMPQLPPPNPDWRHSNQEHFNKHLDIQPKAAEPAPAPQAAPQDIRDRYKFQ